MIILGIDPGLSISGFGILKKEAHQKVIVVDYGQLQFSATTQLSARIAHFCDFFEKKILQFHVTHIALETPFLGKNTQSFLKLGYLRGILYLLAHRYQLTLYEYAPRQVKLSVTGFGGADKDQVARIIKQLLPEIKYCSKKFDITDALAVALCGFWQQTSSSRC